MIGTTAHELSASQLPAAIPSAEAMAAASWMARTFVAVGPIISFSSSGSLVTTGPSGKLRTTSVPAQTQVGIGYFVGGATMTAG